MTNALFRLPVRIPQSGILRQWNRFIKSREDHKQRGRRLPDTAATRPTALLFIDALPNGRAGTRRTRYTLSVEAHVSIGNTTHALGAWTLYSKGAFRAFG